VLVDRGEERLELAVATGGNPHPRLRYRLRRGPALRPLGGRRRDLLVVPAAGVFRCWTHRAILAEPEDGRKRPLKRLFTAGSEANLAANGCRSGVRQVELR